MTDATLKLWNFIARYGDKHGFPPSVREMAVGCRLSTSRVQVLLGVLEGSGVIERRSYRARGITLLRRPPGL